MVSTYTLQCLQSLLRESAATVARDRFETDLSLREQEVEKERERGGGMMLTGVFILVNLCVSCVYMFCITVVPHKHANVRVDVLEGLWSCSY